ncbi:MAG: DUF3188 domain-containing protein [Clostridia bacterium]
MSKWYLVLVSFGLLIIMFSENSGDKIVSILFGIFLCGIGSISYLNSLKKEENK